MRPLSCIFGLALLLTIFPTVGSAAPAPDGPLPPLDDALSAPIATTLSAEEGLRGPSQYMAGKVAVRLVLPESNGAAEASSESWTAEEIAHLTSEVRAALDWWATRLAQARLSFTLRVDVAPTAYEPVKHNLWDEGLWISDSLSALGYPGSSYFEQAYAAASDLRSSTGADWATTIFIADSSASPTGYFADGRFAYAYINGPLMVLTSDGGSYGTDRLAPVVAHELGHIFGALDQYAQAQVPCDRQSGYLSAPTSNSQYSGCGGREASIMLSPLGAYAAGQVDASALAQVGYRDSDGDGLIDTLDTTPVLMLSDSSQTASGARPLLNGMVRDQPFPSPTQQQVSVNTITAVEYRLNGNLWLPLPATDGAYDAASEGFSAELPLYDGLYTLEVRATNSAGVISQLVSLTFTVSGQGADPAYRLTAPTLITRASLDLNLIAPASTLAVQVSESLSFAGAEWQPYSPVLAYTLMDSDGAHLVYVRFRDEAGRESLPYALPVTLDTVPPSGTARRDPASPTVLLLTASDATSGVEAVEVQVGSGTPSWQPYTTRLELGPGSEDQPVTLRLRDGAGNISAPLATSLKYVVALPLIIR